MSKKPLRSLITSSKLAVGTSLIIAGCYAMSTPAFALTKQPAENLSQVFGYVLADNPVLAATRSQEKVDKASISAAKAGYLPTLNVNAGYGYSKTQVDPNPYQSGTAYQAGATLNEVIFNGWGTTGQTKFAEEKHQASLYKIEEQKELSALKAAQAYIDVSRYKTLSKLAQENLKKHEYTVSQLEDKGGVKKYSLAEQALGRGRLADAKKNLDVVKGEEINKAAEFEDLTGQKPSDHLKLYGFRWKIRTTKKRQADGTIKDVKVRTVKVGGNVMQEARMIQKFLPKTEHEAWVRADHDSPIKQADINNLEASKASITVARSAYYPTISGQLSANLLNNTNGLIGRTKYWQAMVLGNWNLFNGGADAAAVEKAIQNKNLAQNNLDSVNWDINKSVEQAWNNYQVSLKSIPELKTHVKKAQIVVDGYEVKLNNGDETSVLNALDVANEQYNAEVALANGEYQLLTDEFTLLAAMGDLAPTLENTTV